MHLFPDGSGELVSPPLDATIERLLVVTLTDRKGLVWGGRWIERKREGGRVSEGWRNE